MLKRRVAASSSEYDSARAMLLQQSQSVQTLKNSLATYAPKISAAETSIETAKAKWEEANRNLDRTRIVAPFGGLLTDVALEAGQYVAAGQVLFSVLDTSSVEVEAQSSVSQLSGLLRSIDDRVTTAPVSQETAMENSSGGESEGAEFLMKDQFRLEKNETSGIRDLGLSATVTARSGDLTMSFPGTPIRFVSSLDEQTRTLGTIVRVDNPPENRRTDQRLRPGAYCEVLLTAGHATDAFVIPRTSVDDDTVAVLDAENRLRRRPIRIGFAIRDDLAVVDGLMQGDLVVVNPTSRVVSRIAE
jgi:RND family efflux transporter MFP subunit